MKWAFFVKSFQAILNVSFFSQILTKKNFEGEDYFNKATKLCEI